MKNHIVTITIFLNEENIFDDQIRKLFIHFSVSKGKKRNKEIKTLE